MPSELRNIQHRKCSSFQDQARGRVICFWTRFEFGSMPTGTKPSLSQASSESWLPISRRMSRTSSQQNIRQKLRSGRYISLQGVLLKRITDSQSEDSGSI